MNLPAVLLRLSQQNSASELISVFLSVLNNVQGCNTSGVVLTNLENTLLDQCAYLIEHEIQWLAMQPIETASHSNIMSFCLSTKQPKQVTLTVFHKALGLNLSKDRGELVVLQPLAFANVFGVVFIQRSVDFDESTNKVIALLSEHFATCYASLDKLDIQSKRIKQLEAKLSKEAKANNVHVKRNQRRIQASLIGTSPKMQALRASIQHVAGSNFNVLVRGETGTGKELVAQEIYKLSSHFSGKLIVQNCAAIPLDLLESELFGYEKGAFTGADKSKEGLLTAADNGVLFLDEIGDMPMLLQSKLLRVIQEKVFRPIGSTKEKPARFRLVAATHQPLEKMIKEGTFRSDLFYRLQESLIQVPTLKERSSDVEALSQHFIKQYEEDHDSSNIFLTGEALQTLKCYHFPGNVRELRNIIRQSCLYADDTNQITSEIVSSMLEINNIEVSQSMDELDDDTNNLKASCEQFESTLIRKALTVSGGDRRIAAKKLALPVRTLAYKCQKYGL